jgi:ABC-2 type transport system permease protein
MGAAAITGKDLRIIVRDRRALVLLLATPLVFIAVMGWSTGQIFSSEQQARMWLVIEDRDGSTLSAELVDDLDDRPEFEVVSIDQREQIDVSGLDRVVRVVIGDQYEERILALEIGDVIEIERGALAGDVESLNLEIAVEQVDLPWAGAVARNRPSLNATERAVELVVFIEAMASIVPAVARTDPFMERYLDGWNQTHPLEAVPETPAAPAPETWDANAAAYAVVVPGYTVCFAFFIILYMARAFVTERELGTMDRLKASPVGRGALLAGKIGPYLLLSIVQLALLFIAGRYLFGMAWGPSPGMLIPVVLATALAATGMGALVSSVVRNEAQVISCSVLIVITLGAVSGCFIPRQWMAESIQQVSLATPHAWSLIAFGELLTADRPDIGLVWSAVGILVAFATVLFGLGYWRMRKEL